MALPFSSLTHNRMASSSGIIATLFLVLALHSSWVLLSFASGNVSLTSFVVCSWMLQFDQFVFSGSFSICSCFVGLGRFTLCIWEKDSMKSLTWFLSLTMRFCQMCLEGFALSSSLLASIICNKKIF